MSDFMGSEDPGFLALAKKFDVPEGPPAAPAAPAVPPVEAPAEPVVEAPAAGTEAPSEGTPAPEETEASDDHVVSVGEGEKARKVRVSELRALLDREEAIKSRDTETEAALTRANQEGEKAVAVYSKLVDQAQKDLAQFSALNTPAGWANARAKLPDGAFNQLAADYQAAQSKLNFLTQEANGFVAQVQANRQAQHAEAVKTRDATLDKDTTIPGGWAKVKAEVADFVKSKGLPANLVDTVTHPAALRLLVDAMLFSKGAARVEATVKQAATSNPRTTVRPGATQAPAEPVSVSAARAKARTTGAVDDVAALFAAKLAAR